MKKWMRFILLFLGFLIFVAALLLLHNQLKNLSYIDIVNALKAIPTFRILIALCLALSYYLILGGYDIIAFNYIGSSISAKPKDILFTCFISNVLANNTGYSMLFGGSIRYRLYSAYNVSMIDVTKVLLFSSATIWLGLLAVGGFVFTVEPVILDGIFNLNFSTRLIGLCCVSILMLYFFLSMLHSKSIKMFKWTITFPNVKIVFSQILLATCDWIIASLTLYILMPEGYISYFVLLKVFLVTQFAVIISQVPGGIGVLETSVALLLPNSASNPGIIGALLAYRVIFYFFPLLIALVLLGTFEIVMFTNKFKEKAKIFEKNVSSIMIRIVSLSSFLAGMIAVLSSSIPFETDNMVDSKLAINLLPSWFVDLSHFMLSITSTTLLFISRAIQLRIKNAWNITFALISFAIVLIMIVGEFSLVVYYFIIVLIVLLSSRKYFYRNISVLNTTFSVWWFSIVGAVFVLSIWIGFFVNVQNICSLIHLNTFFNNIFMTGDTARFLRAVLGMLIVIIIVVLEQIFKIFLKNRVLFTKEDIKNIVYSSDYVYAFNALAPDKNYIVNDEKDAFIMYAKSGDSWIVLGDPVGNYAHKNELLWKFKESTDSVSVKPAFIGIDHKYIKLYDDIGLDIFNIGQEAKIQLRIFDKENERFKCFRNMEKEIETIGFQYKILQSEQFEKYREIFIKINKKWESDTNYIERNFIPGKYDDSYMKDMDFGVLEKNSEVCAFSIIAKTKNQHEMSSNIIRYLECDKDIFSYIIFKNILWAKKNKYKWFDLGFAYFPDMDNSGEVVKYFAKMFMFAEHFNYDLIALKKFKDKFSPVWHNKYIAIHPDKYIGAFIRNFTTLISASQVTQGKFFLKRFFKK
ncbi:MAG: phosphatidylglycerol lysyltransferase domain-containing protein [Endomicrobium sp.]|jgi:phosphatidylglycerol lysyltransferase|nr:phosphatidylglycerol lysyltransferase domain-containing protein [Endomicrobium sp.]